MTIRLLSDEVISKISAGEVIERPVSVVKELIENSIDAQADTISVQIEGAGKKRIEISDNGIGIPADELHQAVQRHATSKLNQADDLFHIHTLGFRGEALAAAGAVSRLRISSRTGNAAAGRKLVVDGGVIHESQVVSLPVGTIVEVDDLFYNIPARYKFLKSDVTEKNQIDTLISRYALAYPKIRWTYAHDQKTILTTSGNGDAREVLAAIYGAQIARQLLEINLSDEAITVGGFISPVALTRSNRREINFFVNGRWIQDSQLSAAVVKAYQSLIMIGRYPIAALFLTLDPEEIDVNVHPSKAEIRFRSGDRVFSIVHRAVRMGLIAQSPVPEISAPRQWQTWRQEYTESRQTSSGSQIDPAWNMARAIENEDSDGHLPLQTGFVGNGVIAQEAQPGVLAPNAPLFPILRWIGQIGGTYLLAEGPDGLYLIDQHAAHERILFEQLLESSETRLPSQHLLEAEIVHLLPWQAELMENSIPVLEKLGFRLEPFGPAAFRVLALPAIFKKGNAAAAVKAVIEEIEEDEEPLKAEIENLLAARICKRMAVKAGQTLSEEEQRALLRDLESCVSPRTCPHGRPTMIHLSINLLEQQFGRKGKI